MLFITAMCSSTVSIAVTLWYQWYQRTVRNAQGTQGTHFVRQGEVGLEFFILFSGSVSVEVDGKSCATISTGETFGEKVSR
jgi:hypothetical protein